MICGQNLRNFGNKVKRPVANLFLGLPRFSRLFWNKILLGRLHFCFASRTCWIWN